jgi:hypothetical protein
MALMEGLTGQIQSLGNAVTTAARLTNQQSVAVAQTEAPNYEATRQGMRFHLAFNGTSPTGIAPVQALPTTAAQWAIWNPSTTKSLVFQTLGVFPSSGTVGVGGQLLVCNFTTPATTGAQATGFAISNGNGGATQSAALVKSGVTITTPSAGLWIPIAETGSPNVGAFPGSGIIVNRGVNGSIIVPPNSGLGFAVLALAGTTPLFLPMAEWTEVVTILG